MPEITDKVSGYSISELLSEYLPFACPKCKENIWEGFVTKNAENFVLICHHCRYVPSMKEILRMKET